MDQEHGAHSNYFHYLATARQLLFAGDSLRTGLQKFRCGRGRFPITMPSLTLLAAIVSTLALPQQAQFVSDSFALRTRRFEIKRRLISRSGIVGVLPGCF
jgi:hypothetical protein